MARNSLVLLTAFLITLCTSACGGGGSSSASAAPLSNSSTGQSGGAAPTPSSTATTTADATQARFRAPQGIAINARGDLFVADAQNFTIRKIGNNGVVTTIAGMPGKAGSADGVGASARFTEPRGIAVDSDDNLYVTDGSTIRKITPLGLVTTIAGTQGRFGDADGTGSLAQFHAPNGIAVDKSGNVYVGDIFDPMLRIRKISPGGAVSTFAGGNAGRSSQIPLDGTGSFAAFVGPAALAIDASGNLFVADVAMGGLTAPNLFDGATFVRKISPEAVVTTVAGNFGFGSLPAGGPTAQISRATAIAVDSAGGNIFVTDRFNDGNRVEKISPSGQVSTMPLDASQFGSLAGLARDTGGNLYVSDQAKHTIAKISPGGTVTIYAGKAGEPGSADTP